MLRQRGSQFKHLSSHRDGSPPRWGRSTALASPPPAAPPVGDRLRELHKMSIRRGKHDRLDGGRMLSRGVMPPESISSSAARERLSS
jgi:hypothetical protein